jgi:hypothetical protein
MDKDQKGKKKTSKTRARKKDKTEQQKNAKQQE